MHLDLTAHPSFGRPRFLHCLCSSITCMPGGMKAWAARGLPTTAEESGKL
jgi:rhodanese-related sulfurtransferase